jgi:hypothetical protein
MKLLQTFPAMCIALFLLLFSCCCSQAAATPDLTVDTFKVVPVTPTSAGTAALVIVIKNVGTGTSKSVPLFFGGDETVLQAFGIPMYNSMEHGVSIPSLNAGQSKEFTFGKLSSMAVGSYTVQAKIWPTKPGATPPQPGGESNLNNNQKDLTFSVTAGASNIPKKPIHKIPQDGQSVPGKPISPLN